MTSGSRKPNVRITKISHNKRRDAEEDTTMVDAEEEDFRPSEDENYMKPNIDLQALFKAAEQKDTSKSGSRASALSKKLNAFAESVGEELVELQRQTTEALELMFVTIDEIDASQVDVDWEGIATKCGTRTDKMHGIFKLYDDIVEMNGPARTGILQDIGGSLDENSRVRLQSRKKLKGQAKEYVKQVKENQQLAVDAKALIKGYKAVLRV